ncbi:hypothetical protein Vafri_20744 [Volvox africanus]|uniref:G-patch domain-containing protein n=1 Tax=Volvox africanus TaxID=51714 RepID=A0A8J4BXJ7_9CHLO|nr:hypothetical protein Vafri_20744 [Volvox africanus]
MQLNSRASSHIMADEIEVELEAQLASQREALAGINEAISLGGDSDSEGHAELQQIKEELHNAVLELESALLEIKKARILQQFVAHNQPGAKPDRLTPDPSPPPPRAAEAVLPVGAQSSISRALISLPAAGSSCHFRYMDGRWYAGRVQGPGRQAGTLSVVFEVPTRPFMLDPVDVMDALVRPCSDAAGAPGPAALAASRAGPSRSAAWATQQQKHHHHHQQKQQQQEQYGNRQGQHRELAVGRKALALLPESRLYVPVEVVALDALRATATVLPLLPRQPHGLPGGSSGAGREVIVPLAVVTRHAHVSSPMGAGRGGDGEDGTESDGGGDDGGGDGSGSSSSSSVSALLRPSAEAEESCEEGDEGEEVEGDGDGNGDSGGEGDEDKDMDLYGSDQGGGDTGGDDDDDEDDGRRRALGSFSRSRGGRGGGPGGGADEEGGGLDVFEHARLAAAAGALDDAALLADWESHSRGVASRLLVRMGYVRGQGLGSRGQGARAAPEVLLLPERKGLGAADKERVRRVGGGGGSGGGSKLQGGVEKRRSKRGGARQKRKRAIIASREARREVREQEEGATGGGGLFDFINSSLGDSSSAARIRKAQVSVAGVAAAAATAAPSTAGAAAIACSVAAVSGGGHPRRPPDRQGLMSHHDNVAAIQTKMSRLQEMLGRHKDNRGLRAQIEAQIRTVQAELAAAQSAAARASKAISDKDAQKKWLKF